MGDPVHSLMWTLKYVQNIFNGLWKNVKRKKTEENVILPNNVCTYVLYIIWSVNTYIPVVCNEHTSGMRSVY
jgi:hypothetical protein